MQEGAYIGTERYGYIPLWSPMWEHLHCRCPNKRTTVTENLEKRLCHLRGSPNLQDLRNNAWCIPYILRIFPTYLYCLSFLFKIVAHGQSQERRIGGPHHYCGATPHLDPRGSTEWYTSTLTYSNIFDAGNRHPARCRCMQFVTESSIEVAR